MPEDIFFSVLVPVYNVMDYIDDCIQSVLSQTYQNYEIILVDDGSTDKSGIIIDQYADKNPKIKAFHKENNGQFHTRRFAINQASGDYYVMLDSDDMLESNGLEILYNTIKKHNCDCVFYNRKLLINGKETGADYHIKEEYLAGRENIIKKALIDIPYNSICLKCAKSTVYTNKGYTQYYNIRRGEDALQSLELLANCNTAEFIDNEIYIYRKRQGSICNPTDNTEYEVDLTVRKVCLQFIRDQNCFTEEDMNRYRDKYIAFFIDQIIHVGSLNASKAYKKAIYDELRNDEFYTGFLKKGISSKKSIGYKAIIWHLFKMKCDELLLMIFSIHKMGAKK